MSKHALSKSFKKKLNGNEVKIAFIIAQKEIM